MKKKGFTLIELLAVIVIMAILALIAIPITIKIISDSRENANKQSILHYAKAVEQDVVNWKTENNNLPITDYKGVYKDREIKVTGDKVSCDEIDIDKDMNLTLYSCYLVKYGEDKSKKYDYIDGKVVESDSDESLVLNYAKNIESDITKLKQETSSDNYTEYDFNRIKDDKITCDEKNVSSEGKLTLNKCYLKDSQEEKKTYYSYKNGKVEKEKSSGSNTSSTSNAVQSLLSKVNVENTQYAQGSEESHQMYTFSHPATEQTKALTDYRYIGNDPYNYVDFNCDDNGNNCETWRIVGVFTVKSGTKEEQRIKLIRDESIGNMAWDSNNVNDWPSATLNTYLNGEYYQGFSNLTKSMIEPAETYLGGGKYPIGGTDTIYRWERGTNVRSGCSIKDTNNITLLYPSDYAYTYAKGIDAQCFDAVDLCESDWRAKPSSGWLYKSLYSWWLVSADNDYLSEKYHVSSSGIVNNNNLGMFFGVRPVVYLTSDIKFDGNHTGSSLDHYRLKK